MVDYLVPHNHGIILISIHALGNLLYSPYHPGYAYTLYESAVAGHLAMESVHALGSNIA